MRRRSGCLLSRHWYRVAWSDPLSIDIDRIHSRTVTVLRGQVRKCKSLPKEERMSDQGASHAERRRQRDAMVQQQIVKRGIHSPEVIAALRKVPREKFIAKALGKFAYEDAPLPIAEQQTISQPYIVAFMLEALQLKGPERVLEIGTGSGYAAALLAELAAEVITLERYQSLADEARAVLQGLGYHNVEVIQSDGTLGWPEQAPYEGIVVAAAAPEVPQALKN